MVDQPVGIAEVARLPERVQEVEEEDSPDEDARDVEGERVDGGREGVGSHLVGADWSALPARPFLPLTPLLPELCLVRRQFDRIRIGLVHSRSRFAKPLADTREFPPCPGMPPCRRVHSKHTLQQHARIIQKFTVLGGTPGPVGPSLTATACSVHFRGVPWGRRGSRGQRHRRAWRPSPNP